MAAERGKLIGLTGGIGAGKSVVSRVLRLRGYSVYDCDSEARRIMNASEHVRSELIGRWGSEVYGEDGTMDRARVASIVFEKEAERLWLNGLVHGLVCEDIKTCDAKSSVGIMFVESAILYESGLAGMCSEVWHVTAPETLRMERVMKRSGLSAGDAMERIRSQQGEERLATKSNVRRKEIVNDGRESVLWQTGTLLKQIEQRHKNKKYNA